MNCRFTVSEIDGRMIARCDRCGLTAVVESASSIVALCRPGLGDMVAATLGTFGITKERVELLVGGPCGCPERQAALNAAGAKWLGLSPGSTAPPDVDPPT